MVVGGGCFFIVLPPVTLCPLPASAETLQERMNENNYSQKEMSQLLGISTPRLSEIINGKKTPTYDQARKMVLKLGISPAIVFGALNV